MSRLVRLRRPIFVAVAGLFSFAMVASAHRARARDANTAEVITGFSAKETCSCVFVVDQTDAYCTAFGKPPGAQVSIAIDRTAKTVTSTASGISRTARMQAGEGCTVDALP